MKFQFLFFYWYRPLWAAGSSGDARHVKDVFKLVLHFSLLCLCSPAQPFCQSQNVNPVQDYLIRQKPGTEREKSVNQSGQSGSGTPVFPVLPDEKTKFTVSRSRLQTEEEIDLDLYSSFQMTDPNQDIYMNGDFLQRWGVVSLVYGREENSDVVGKYWSYQVEYILFDNGVLIDSGTLQIHHAAGGGIYEKVGRHVVNSGNLECRIVGYGGLPAPDGAFPDDIRVQFSLEVYWKATLNNSAPRLYKEEICSYKEAGESCVNAEKDKVRLAWSYVRGADRYELEFRFLDAQAPEPDLHPAFRDVWLADGTRLLTDRNWYDLDLCYPEGKLYYRVRAIGVFTENPSGNQWPRRTGPWSKPLVTRIGEVGDAGSFEVGKNWQSAVTYYSDGKKQTGIRYFDGLLRVRQQLTTSLASGRTMVEDSDYGIDGLPLLQVLPVPAGGSAHNLFFKYDFNQTRVPYTATNGQVWHAYGFRDFDRSGGAAPLNENAGAGLFYSSLNNDNGLYRDYLPDAGGFPLQQTEYYRDGRNKIRALGGVGAFNQPGSGRDTRYYSTSVDETELRRLFGSEAGDAVHYRKEILVDPNGRIQYTILDLNGKKIVTALAGEAPSNLVSLDSELKEEVTRNLMGNNIHTGGSSTTLVQMFNAVEHTAYTFSYNLTGAREFIENGQGVGFCKECEYILSITIKDPQGNPVELERINGGNPGNTTTGFEWVEYFGSALNDAPGDCVEGTYGNQDLIFTAVFEAVGPYEVVKELQVRPYPPEDQNSLLVENGLLPDLQGLIDSFIQDIDPTECYYSCVHECYDQVLATDPGLVNFPEMLVAAIQACLAVSDCEDYTASVEASTQGECAGMLIQMKAQLHARYGETQEGPIPDFFGPGGIVSHKVEILSDTFLVEGEDGLTYWVYGGQVVESTSGYLVDEVWIAGNGGARRQINSVNDIWDILTGSSSLGLPLRDLFWQEKWLDVLVRYHREYCHYLNCLDLQPSRAYQAILDLLNSWQEAAAFTGVPYQSGQYQQVIDGLLGYAGINADPVFNLFDDPVFFDCNIDLQQAMDDQIRHYAALPFWECPPWDPAFPEHVMTTVNCTVNSLLATGNIQPVQAEAVSWATFRSIYKSLLLKLRRECTAGCPIPADSFAINTITLPETVMTGSDESVFLNTAPLELAVDMCAGTIEFWVESIQQKLLDCSGDTLSGTLLLQLKSLLQDHCTLTWHPGIPDANPDALMQALDLIEDELGGCDQGETLEAIASLIEQGDLIGGGMVNSCFEGLIEIIRQEMFPIPPGAPEKILLDTGNTGCFESIIWKNTVPSQLLVSSFRSGCGSLPADFILTFRQASGAPFDMSGSTIGVGMVTYLDVPAPPHGEEDIAYDLGVSMDVLAGGDTKVVYLYADRYLPRRLDDCAFGLTLDLADLFQDCVDEMYQEATDLAYQYWQQQADQILSVMDDSLSACLKNTHETFSVTFETVEHQYTLYYYNQAGDLIRTVPPAGVSPVPYLHFPGGIWDGTEPAHGMSSTYCHNTLGRVICQETPDAGATVFLYDRSQRLRLAQDARQQNVGSSYSYYKYDQQDRVIETGQLDGYELNSADLEDPAFPEAGLTLAQVNNMYYDRHPGSASTFRSDLRGRLAATENEHITTLYSYDVVGHICSFYQEIEELGIFETNYKYDQPGGPIQQIAYQAGSVDQFYHRYVYDEDNRLEKVFTSADGFLWEQDARYYHYAHGPVARVELGHDQVQGEDYWYTLEGWIKGVNLPGRESQRYELGRDGDEEDLMNQNRYFARDEMAYALGYSDLDYSSVGSVPLGQEVTNSWSQFATQLLPKNFDDGPHYGFFNGNIAWMITDIREFQRMGQVNAIQAYAYQYDVLNRLRQARDFYATHQFWSLDPEANHTSYQYDPNGNLKYLERFRDAPLDAMFYTYPVDGNGKLTRNQLAAVSGFIDGATSSRNFSYNELGNLISSPSESLEEIEWDRYGKVTQVHFLAGSGKPDVQFAYDTGGNRLRKVIDDADQTTTSYVRGPDGAVLSVYTRINGQRKQTEVPLYGTGRIGVRLFADRNLGNPPPSTESSERRRGEKLYELSNHLGNVLVTVSDRKIGIPLSGHDWVAGYYLAEVRSAQDFYPFGLRIPNNNNVLNGYRYGFNGKENDENHEFGNDLVQDYGFRLYAPRVARFLSVDPLTTDYPGWSPYPFAMNRVVDGVDLDGLEWRNATKLEIKLYETNSVTANKKGIYNGGNGEYFTWVGKDEYETIITSNEVIDNKITFDEKVTSVPFSNAPYRRFNKDGHVQHIYHNFELAPWMQEAWFYQRVGLKEIKGEKHNPVIMQMHNSATNGWIPTTDDDSGPWCSSFACYIMDNSYSGLYQGGFTSPRNASSLSWRKWGREIDFPVYGSIAVKTRKGGGHVGFVVGQSLDGRQIALLGGNQNDGVNINLYNRNLFKFFVPSNYIIPDFSKNLPVYGRQDGGSIISEQ